MRLIERPNTGREHTSRIEAIMAAWNDLGWTRHEDRVRYRDNSIEYHPVQDIMPATGEDVYRDAGNYHLYGFTASPRALTYVISKRSEEALAAHLNVRMVEIRRQGNLVIVQVPKATQDNWFSFTECLSTDPSIPPGCLLLGRDQQHNQLLLEITSSKHVHVAVVGMTGAGKTTIMRAMAWSALLSPACDGKKGQQVALFDPSDPRLGLAFLSGHPAVWRSGLFRDIGDIVIGLKFLERQIQDRVSYDPGKLFVFIDEWPLVKHTRPDAQGPLQTIINSGRPLGIHVILGTQYLRSEVLDGKVQNNIPVRIMGRMGSATESYTSCGRTGAEKLLGNGDMLLVTSETIRFQAPLCGQDEIAQWVKEYPPRLARIPLLESAVVPESDNTAEEMSTGGPGRGLDEIDQTVIDHGVKHFRQAGKVSTYWVRRWTAENLPGGEYNQHKAWRAVGAITEAAASTGESGDGR